MTDAVVEAPKPEAEGQIASWWHLLLVLVLLSAGAYRGSVNADVMTQARNFNRPIFYLVTIAFEWVMLGIVVLGVRRYGAPLSTILGDRWKSIGEVGRDIGLAVSLAIFASFALSATMGHSQDTAPEGVVQALLPHGALEDTLWILLSVSAGICEEAVFRGYLQRQLIALTRNVPAGILLSAIVFGVGHVYKGIPGAIRIVLFGVLFGIMAYWRRSVRPGMIAHAFTDSFAGVLAGALKVKVA